jgi:hypothetical protein
MLRQAQIEQLKDPMNNCRPHQAKNLGSLGIPAHAPRCSGGLHDLQPMRSALEC